MSHQTFKSSRLPKRFSLIIALACFMGISQGGSASQEESDLSDLFKDMESTPDLPKSTPAPPKNISSKDKPTIEMAPEIVPVWGKFKTAIDLLNAARSAAVSKLQEKYLAELKAAEKDAIDRGNLTAVGSIMKERENLVANSLEEKPAEDLPKTLARGHALQISSMATLDQDFSLRFQKARGDLLRDITSLETRLPVTSPTLIQTRALKERLVATAALGGSQKLTNETFDNTEWWWEAHKGRTVHDKMWKFLPNGKIVTDTGATNYGWKILSPDTFMLTANGSNYFKFTANLNTMIANGINVSDSSDTKIFIFKGKLSKGDKHYQKK